PSALKSVAATRAPSAANTRAVARPIPLAAPVTRTREPLTERLSSLNSDMTSSGIYERLRATVAPCVGIGVGHDERHNPAGNKQDNDSKTESAEIRVEPGDPVPESALQAEAVRNQSKGLHAGDSERNGDRERCDHHVIHQLAPRILAGPTVGAQHQHTVERVDQGHAGGEQCRKHQDGGTRDFLGGLRGQREQTDLTRGLETEREQETERKQVPAGRDKAEQGPEQPCEPAALL